MKDHRTRNSLSAEYVFCNPASLREYYTWAHAHLILWAMHDGKENKPGKCAFLIHGVSSREWNAAGAGMREAGSRRFQSPTFQKYGWLALNKQVRFDFFYYYFLPRKNQRPRS